MTPSPLSPGAKPRSFDRIDAIDRLGRGESVQVAQSITITTGSTDSWGLPVCSLEAEGFDPVQVRGACGFWLNTSGLSATEIVLRAAQLLEMGS